MGVSWRSPPSQARTRHSAGDLREVRRKQMKAWNLFVPALLSLGFGCSAGGGPLPEEKPATTEQKLGQISLDLLGQDRTGNAYRLRNATFDIRSYYLFVPSDADAGPVSLKVSSETHP